jgi:hypothetical protein
MNLKRPAWPKESLMNPDIQGIHHITAIASDPQANVDFYTGVPAS